MKFSVVVNEGYGLMSRDNNEALVSACETLDRICGIAKEKLESEFREIAKRLSIYSFRSRLKGAAGIYDKIERKRAELIRAGKTGAAEQYGPGNVNDGWGIRFITRYQYEVRDLLQELIDFSLRPSSAQRDLSIVEIEVYSSQPEEDPLSIYAQARKLVLESGLPNEVKEKKGIGVPIINRTDGYSSLHIVFGLPVTNSTPGGTPQKTRACFEVQIRDIFEEGWAEVSRGNFYGDKDSTVVKAASERYEDEIRQRRLNALKSSSDSCSQHATLVRNTLDYWATSFGKTGEDLSVSSLDEDRDGIINVLNENGCREDDRAAVGQAYRRLKDAHNVAAVKKDSRTAQSFYAAAASSFEDAIGRVEDYLKIPTAHRINLPIEYYLRLELANALVRSVETDLLPVSDEAMAHYELLYSDPQYINDTTIRLRLAQAKLSLSNSPQEYQGSIEMIREALNVRRKDDLLKPDDWIHLELPRFLALACFKLSKCYGQYALQQPNEAQKELCLTNQRSWLDAAVQQAVATADVSIQWVKSGSGAVNIAHKCMSNALYFSYMLAELEGGVINYRLESETSERIQKYMSNLQKHPYRRFTDSHPETIDNLILGAHLLGNIGLARQKAEENYRILVQIAKDKAQSDELESVEKYLSESQIEMYQRAYMFLDPTLAGVFRNIDC